MSLRQELASIEYNKQAKELDNLYHRTAHVQFLKGEYQPTEADQKAWDSDSGFWSLSAVKEYRDGCLPKFYPDVYNPSEEQITNETDKWLNKISKKDMDKLYAVWKNKSTEDAIKYQVHYLSGLLNLHHEPNVNFIEEDGPDEMAGAFDPEGNNIYFWVGEKKGSDNVWSDNVSGVAHEMWHAHQQDMLDYDPDSAAAVRYSKNREIHRYTIIENYKMYQNQVEEAEAFHFGYEFTRPFYDAKRRSERPLNKLFSRFSGKDEKSDQRLFS